MRKLMFALLLSSASGFAAAGDFYGYYCTDDCSGHQAGWDWAEDNDISDVDECGGYSQSFIEGCWAYVEETHGDDGEEWDEFDSLEDCEWEYGEGAEECEHLE